MKYFPYLEKTLLVKVWVEILVVISATLLYLCIDETTSRYSIPDLAGHD
jgi:hypothetical protein